MNMNDMNNNNSNSIFPNANNHINDLYHIDNDCKSYIDDRIVNNNDKRYRVFPYCKQSWGSVIKYITSKKIPNRLLDQARHSELSYKTGILPEINRVWVSIDNKLYLWNYDNDNADCIYTMSEVITCVGLIKPMEGIFNDKVKYLMVVATAGEISILAVMYDSRRNQVNLTSTPYIVDAIVDAEDITITKITGSDKGRIFLGTANGSLCELKYDAEVERDWVPILRDVSNIFNKVTLGSGFNNDEPRPKIRKIKHNSWSIVIKRLKETQKGLTSLFSKSGMNNTVQTNPGAYKLVDESINHLVVDNERNILYAVSLNQLQVFSLGDDGMNTDALCINDHDIINRIIANKLVGETAIRQSGDVPFNIVSLTPIKKIESDNIDFMVVLNTGLRVYLKLVPKISFSLPDWDVDVVYVRKPAPETAFNDCSTINNSEKLYEPDKAFIPHTEVKYSSCFNGTFISATSKIIEDERLSLTLKKRENDIFCITLDYKENAYYDENICLMNIENLMQDSRSIPFTKDVQDIAEEIPPNDGGYFNLFYAGDEKGFYNELRDESIQNQRKFMCLTLTDLHFFVKQRPVDVLRFILISRSPNNELMNFFRHYGTVNGCAVCFALTYHFRGDNDAADIIDAAMNVALDKGGSPSIDHMGQFIPSSLHNSLYLYASRILTPIWHIEIARLKDHYISDQIFLNALSEPISSLFLLLENNRHFSFIKQNENFADSHDPIRKEHSSIRELYQLLKRTLEIIRLVKCLCYFEKKTLINKQWIDMLYDAGRGYTFRECITVPIVKDKIQLLIFDMIKQLTITGIPDVSPEIDDNIITLHEEAPNYFTSGDLSLYKGMKEYERSKGNFFNLHFVENFKDSSKYWNEVDVKETSKLSQLCGKLQQVSVNGLIELCICAGLNFDKQNGVCDDVVSYKRMYDMELRGKCKKACFDEMWRQYKNLNLSDGGKKSFVEHSIRSGGHDLLFQRLLCEYLYTNDRKQLLHYSDQQLANPSFIEEFLKKDLDKILDLYDYYDIHDMHLNAGILMKNIGSNNDLVINISKRIEYLQKAQTSYSHFEGSRGFNQVNELLSFAKIQQEAYKTIHNYLVEYLDHKVPKNIIEKIKKEEHIRQYDDLKTYVRGQDARILSEAQRENISSLARLAEDLNSRLFTDLELFNETDKYKVIELSLKIIVQSKHLESNRSQLLRDYMRSYIYSLIPLEAESPACKLFLRFKRLEVYNSFNSINKAGKFDDTKKWLEDFEKSIISLGTNLLDRMDKDEYGNIVNIRTRNELESLVYVIVTELEEISATLVNRIAIGWTGSILREMKVHRLIIVNSLHTLLHDWTGQSLDKRALVACSISNELNKWIEDAKEDQQARIEIESSIASIKDILNSLSITMHSLAKNYKISKSSYNVHIKEADEHLKNVTEEVRKQYHH